MQKMMMAAQLMMSQQLSGTTVYRSFHGQEAQISQPFSPMQPIPPNVLNPSIFGAHLEAKSAPNADPNGQTFAKALAALGQDVFVDESGAKHDWRQELTQELASRQNADGSWSNETVRWMEGDPNLTTGYALLALAYCRN